MRLTEIIKEPMAAVGTPQWQTPVSEAKFGLQAAMKFGDS